MSDNENGFSDFFDIYWASCDISATVLYVPAGTKTAYAQADVWKGFGFILEPGDDDSFVSQIVRDGITVDGIAYQINGYKGIARAIVIREDMTDVVFKNEIKLGDKTLAVTGLTGNPQGDRLIRKDYNSVVVPASIETLGKGFISEATLGSLTFEEGSHLKTIEDDAITLLTTKSPLVLPEGLKTISGLTLRDADITIPESVTTIENNMFYNLKHVRVAWPTPLAASNLFNKGQFEAGNNIDDATLHVPEGAKDLYAAADGWKLFSKIVEGNDDGLGDVNEDGMVNIADVVMLTNVIIEDSSDLKYDINGDGKVDTNDIIALVNIIAGNAP